MGSGKSTVDVTIRLEKSASAKMDEIVRALEGLGLKEVEPHHRFMVVNGRASVGSIDKMKQVEGVASVREDQIYTAQ